MKKKSITSDEIYQWFVDCEKGVHTREEGSEGVFHLDDIKDVAVAWRSAHATGFLTGVRLSNDKKTLDCLFTDYEGLEPIRYTAERAE